MAISARALVAALCICRVQCYWYVANCVPGTVVSSLNETKGVIGLYTKALQTLLPTTYDSLDLLALGENEDCLDAANAINSNSVMLNDIPKKYNMDKVGILNAFKKANEDQSYLYVFHTKGFQPYYYISTCASGGIVADLNQTEGKIALYSLALKQLLPNVYGNVMYIGQSETALDCMEAMNSINAANSTALRLLKKGGTFNLKEVGLLEGLHKGNVDATYLYVFKNIMWDKKAEWWV